jgi:hypothetical protein
MKNIITIANLWGKDIIETKRLSNKGLKFTKSNKICPHIVIEVLEVPK